MCYSKIFLFYIKKICFSTLFFKNTGKQLIFYVYLISSCLTELFLISFPFDSLGFPREIFTNDDFNYFLLLFMPLFFLF